MSSFLSRFKQRVELQAKKNKFDLSCTHITTQDFFKNKPVYIKEVIPGESLKINVEHFTRLSPLTEPFLGSCRAVNHAFFVPMRTIFDKWNEFITQAKYISHNQQDFPSDVSYVPNVPYSDNATFAYLFSAGYTENDLTEQVTNSAEYDFFGYDPLSGETHNYKFTSKGKHIYDILCGLGYRIDFDYSENQDTFFMRFSLLPLFAYCKIVNDWFSNPAYFENRSIEFWIRDFFEKDSVNQFTYRELYDLVNECELIHYLDDYFTSAWDNPVSPNDIDSSSNFNISDITNSNSSAASKGRVSSVNTSYYGQSPNGTPTINNANGSTTGFGISQFLIDSLKRLSDYVNRLQYSGVRVLDRYASRFGFTLESAKLNRSLWLGRQYVPISISDVMQTSENNLEGSSVGSGLGNYAGKGIAFDGNGNFELQPQDEYGYFVITSYIEPKLIYGDGRQRMLFHVTPFDFFNGAFDNLGPQAIRFDELCSGNMKATPTGKLPNSIFGYTRRYAEYKVGEQQDNITGDFIVDSRNANLDGWILARRYTPAYVLEHSLSTIHDNRFTIADGPLYNNIFVDQSAENDHFFSLFHFNVESFMPAKPLYDVQEWNSDGKEVVSRLNGTQINDD